MVFWICGWQFSQIFFNNRAGCFPLGLSWNPVRAEHGLSKDVQGTAPGRKVGRGGGSEFLGLGPHVSQEPAES